MAGKQETRDDQETRASLQPNDSWEYSPSRKESEAQAFETLELERSLDVAGMNDDVVIDSAEAVFCGVSLPCKGRKRFLLLCAGAILSAIGFAALQEGVWRVHGFHYSGYMTLLTAATMASCGQLERLCTGDTNRVGSLKSYLKLSLLTLSGMYFTNWSLQFLNYPTRVLFKSSKLVPTMTMGTVMQGRRYSGLEYVAALGLIAGATLFILGDAETKPDFEVIGVVLIVCGVCADAATSNYEEREFFRVAEPASQPEVMTFASLFGSLWALLLLLPSSELGEALAHSAENPSVVPLLLSSAVCGYVSVSFVLLLINLYGATVTEVVKSMRKILTVTLSFVLYPKPFSAKYLLGGLAVLLSLGAIHELQKRKGGDVKHGGSTITPLVRRRTRKPACCSLRCCRRCCAASCALLASLGLAWYVAWQHLSEKNPVRLWPRQFARSELFNTLFQPSDTAEKGRAYFESQLPLMEASARNFECLNYWCEGLSVPSVHTSWYGLITNRYDNMYRQMREDPRNDDFRFEKNKCDMYDWYMLNQFRHARIYHRWSARGEWGTPPVGHEAVMADLIANRSGVAYPSYFKACHITQGWAHSTRRVKSYKWLHDNRAMLDEWLGRLWGMHADDWERPWVVAHNAMTDTLGPGMLIQEGFPGSWVSVPPLPGGPDPDADGAVVELKVYVIWGHAYMASFHTLIILRDGTIEEYTGWRAMIHGHTNSPWLHWLYTEGHLERAWLLAETAALTVGIEMARFDFFCRKGDPDAIIANENSISSAASPIYHHHFDYMSYAWARGHIERWYQPYDSHGKRTYELSHLHPPHPNQARLQQKLAEKADLARRVGLLVNATA